MFHNIIKSSLFKINIVRNNFQICHYCAAVSNNTDVEEFFKQNFDFCDDKIKKIFKKNPSFTKQSSTKLHDNLYLLMSFGFFKEDIIKNIQILTQHQITIKNYIMLLEEGGFFKHRIDTYTLLRFKHISNKTIATLKNERFIPKDIDVQHNILSFVQFPTELYPTCCDDSLTWEIIQRNVFNLYIGWKLNMNIENIKLAQAIYKRLLNKSFRLMEKSIDILLNEFNFKEQKIQKHPYLIHTDADNIQAILDNFKVLCGEDIKITINKHPKILLTSWKTIKKIQQHFEEFGIPEYALGKLPEIYTLGSKTIYNRLCHIKETPDLASLINNPQIARLVYYYKNANSRLKYLQYNNCLSLNLLVTNNNKFKRFRYNGAIKGKTNDIMVYLTKELNEDKNKLRSLLERHPCWMSISLLTIRITFEFLKENDFTNDQILQCPYILLYPVNKIKDTLTSIQNVKNVSCLRNSSGQIKSDYMLSLILYELEKKYYFSGGGVWNTNEQNKEMSLLEHAKNTYIDTEELDHVPSVKFNL